jgi:hypothetical protein
MSIKGKEIRIRGKYITTEDHKRIMLAARNDDVSAGYFCLCAALRECDRKEQVVLESSSRR